MRREKGDVKLAVDVRRSQVQRAFKSRFSAVCLGFGDAFFGVNFGVHSRIHST